jgi:hypothetical protein
VPDRPKSDRSSLVRPKPESPDPDRPQRLAAHERIVAQPESAWRLRKAPINEVPGSAVNFRQATQFPQHDWPVAAANFRLGKSISQK